VPKRLLCTILFLASLPIAAQQAATPPPAQAPAAAAAPKRIPIPETFTNLTVLPANISRTDLMAIMRQYSITFKVRCSACHAVNDDLTEGNFTSDDKPMKADTRKLMLLIQKTATPVKP
jgi:mono/diheme cytochrome c family protein